MFTLFESFIKTINQYKYIIIIGKQKISFRVHIKKYVKI